MEYHIVRVRRSPIDEQCLEITLELKPSFWQRLRRAVPCGKITFRGYGKSWYQAPGYSPAPAALADVLFNISYDRQYRHLQCAADRSGAATYESDPLQ